MRGILKNRYQRPVLLVLFFGLMLGCTSVLAASSAQDVAVQLNSAFRKIANISSDISIVLGVCLFMAGLYNMKRYGEARTMMSTHITFSKPFMPILCGTLLISFPSAIGLLMQAVWGDTWNSPLAYEVQSDYDVLVPTMLALVRLIGVLSFLRAILSAVNAVGPNAQPGMKSKVIVLLIAGLLCLNVTGALHLINNIFGFSDQF